MRTSDFDYNLPPELIAQMPAEPRDSARLLVLDRAGSRLEHRVFHELPDLLRPDDVLVANNSRVLPARLLGRRAAPVEWWRHCCCMSSATTSGWPWCGRAGASGRVR